MADQVTNYQCPSCTGPLHFEGSTGRLECEYCGSSYSVEEIEQMYAAKNANAEAAMETADAKEAQAKAEEDEWSMSAEEWNGEGMKAYNCPSCGAELLVDETTAATSCPYCGNPTVVPGQFKGILKPEYIIPFKLDKNAATEALKKHYKGKFFLPKAFTAGNHIEEIKGVYVPFWLYDGYAHAAGVYEAIRTHTRRQGDYKIITKEHFLVEREGDIAFEKIPADASSKMPDDLMDSIEPFNYDELKGFSMAYLPGYLADKYDVSAQQNAQRATARARKSAQDALREDIKGYDSVTPNYQNAVVKQGKVSYALLPVWMLNTKWNGKDYLFAMNGQTGRLVGDLPMDKKKFWLTFAGIAVILEVVMAAVTLLL